MSRAAGRCLTNTDIARLCALAFLHDLGKVNRGFWRRQFAGAPPVGHTTETAALFYSSVAALPEAERLRALLSAWGVEQLFYAVMAHHGRPLDIYAACRVDARVCLRSNGKAADLWIDRDDYAPLAQLGRLLDEAGRRFPLAYFNAPPLPSEPAFVSLFCGLLTLADWLGSDTALFPLTQPRSEAMQAGAAVRAITSRGLGALSAPSRSFAEAFAFAPRGLQTAADDPALGPIALLEAETGSGKTEAALWRWLALRWVGAVDGLYFALPTRSAAVQLHDRIQNVLDRVFPAPSPKAVLAVPGYLRAGDEEGQALPDFRVAWSSDTENDGRWAAERPKRFLAARIAVGTIDQVLMAGLQVKHAHLRAACLSRSLLVVDEVHASDAFMGRLLQQVLANHRALGGHALLLSATLGAEARARLLGEPATASFAAACDTPYPALSGTDRAPLGATRVAAAKHVALEAWPCIDDADAIARRAIQAARAGASVLVVRNSVRGAIAVARAVEAMAPELAFRAAGVATLHHGRFSPDDRRLLDAAVEAAFGKERDHRGRILCGTQTLEQSLDLDADLLLTDLAPMDVLLQRIGRLHRHPRRDRGPFGAARAIVLTPAERDLSTLLDHARHGLGTRRDGTAGAYPDVLVLEATLRLIEANPAIAIPADNRRLIEGALHPEVLQGLARELGTSWSNHAAQQAGSRVAERQLAERWALDLAAPFDTLLFLDKDDAVATRLGLRDRLVDFDPPFAGPFGQPVRRLTIPGLMARSIPAEAETTVEGAGDAGTRLCVGSSRFVYGRMGLESLGPAA